MIEGNITPDRVPQVILDVGGRSWTAIIDIGFNGGVELPEALKGTLAGTYIGPMTSILAAGQTVVEEAYSLTIPFDGEDRLVMATFVEGDEILIGTQLLERHTLHIDFPEQRLTLQKN